MTDFLIAMLILVIAPTFLGIAIAEAWLRLKRKEAAAFHKEMRAHGFRRANGEWVRP